MFIYIAGSVPLAESFNSLKITLVAVKKGKTGAEASFPTDCARAAFYKRAGWLA
jgi:hypothetical protein